MLRLPSLKALGDCGRIEGLLRGITAPSLSSNRGLTYLIVGSRIGFLLPNASAKTYKHLHQGLLKF